MLVQQLSSNIQAGRRYLISFGPTPKWPGRYYRLLPLKRPQLHQHLKFHQSLVVAWLLLQPRSRMTHAL
jgi:hypothetical protein